MSRLFISFSGGETSAFMAQWLLANRADRYDEIVCLFANTGQENEATLRFVQQCDDGYGLGVTWVEAVVNDRGQACGHRVVSHGTASRQGEPFESVVEKYGIPNQAYPHCTRELKLNPMISYLRSIGWESGSYDSAIGIRADEIDRIAGNAREKRLIYPLISDIEMTKPRVNAWWQQQPFRLQLKGYEGNCKWCWKKSFRKHLTLMTEHPEWYDFPERMEREHGLSGHNVDGTPRVFFRQGMSTQELREIAAGGGFTPAGDDAQVYEDQLSLDLDASNGCSESCEISFEEVA
ncbi:hypothetical protein EQG41_18200 [Billgrantia azerbaijanica]|nr:hypothetical protein EQG41_18200 [Halomonas azerbaijanica]